MHKSLTLASLVLAFLMVGCTATSEKLLIGKTNFDQKNYSEAYQELLPLAMKGNADAEYAVGYMYYYGKGAPKNRTLATEWISKAAAQGQAQAVKALRVIEQQENVSKTTPSPIDTLH